MDKHIINLSEKIENVTQDMYGEDVVFSIIKGDNLIELKINYKDYEKAFDNYRDTIGEPKVEEIEDTILSLQDKIEHLEYEIECLRNPDEMRD